MILTLIALISIVGISSVCAEPDSASIFKGMALPMIAVFGFFGLALYALAAFNYVGAGQKAEIINREYGTNYTQKEVFYASDVIETIREMKRQRIELNGNLINKD